MSGMPSPINPSLAATLIANNKESLGRVSVLSFAGGSEVRSLTTVPVYTPCQ
jgi:hypothetical protein